MSRMAKLAPGRSSTEGVSVIRPPSGMACVALISRLSSTCEIWPLCALTNIGRVGGSNSVVTLLCANLSRTRTSVSVMMSLKDQRECRLEGACAKLSTRPTIASS